MYSNIHISFIFSIPFLLVGIKKHNLHHFQYSMDDYPTIHHPKDRLLNSPFFNQRFYFLILLCEEKMFFICHFCCEDFIISHIFFMMTEQINEEGSAR